MELPALKNEENDVLWQRTKHADDERLFVISELIRRKTSIEEIHQVTKIDLFFLTKLKGIIDFEAIIKENAWNLDITIANYWNTQELNVYQFRKENGLIPVYKMVDTCSAEFESKTPYYYGTYETANESHRTDKPSVVVLGSGPMQRYTA